MIHINVICVGKIKEKFFKDAVLEYSKRLSRYCKLNIIEVPDEAIPDDVNDKQSNNIKIIEGKKILQHIKNTYTIALDLNGKQYASEDFASKINSISLNFNSNISFIIGGSLGLSDEVLNSSNELISFSNMTFPHQLIRVFLLEQIYRAFKILNNETYHK